MFVSPVPDFKGGAERSLFDLMANGAVEAILVVPANGPLRGAACARGIACELLALGRVEGIRRPFRLGQAWGAAIDGGRAVRRLRRLALDRGADIIHTNGPKPHSLACVARLLGGPPVVVHLRQIPWTRVERMVWWLWGRCASRLVLVSRACWPWPTLPRHARVVPNAIETPRIGARGPLHDPLQIGFVGRIAPDKGLDVLLDWLALARDRGVRFELRIRGSAAAEAAAYARAIRQKVAALALAERTHFDGFRERPERIYEGLDVVVVPSTVPDPLPRVVMETQSLGIPVIAYPSGGIPDMIQDRQTGFLVATADAFVGVLHDLVSRPALAREIAGNAHQALAQRSSMGRLHAEMSGIYRALRPDHGMAPP